MCGIYCEIFSLNDAHIDDEIKKRLINRGPNSCNTIQYTVFQYRILFYGTVLWMQGSILEPQPLEDEAGILLFNGDILDKNWSYDVCDTLQILKLLNQPGLVCLTNRHQNIISVLLRLKGPFSLIYYDKITCNLYFARDKIGRNSLLFYQNNTFLCISSVLGRKYDCIEVPASNLYMLNLKGKYISLYQWDGNLVATLPVENWIESSRVVQNTPNDQLDFNFELPNIPEDNWIEFIQYTATQTTSKNLLMQKLLENPDINNVVEKLIEYLEESVKIRINTQPHMCKDCLPLCNRECKHCTVGVLFSGGLDCTILAFLVDKLHTKDNPIDLINVAFKKNPNKSYEVPDRITGRQSFEELKSLRPMRKWVFHEVNIPLEELEQYQKTTVADLVHPRQTILDESLGSALWFAARAKTDSSVSPCRVLLLGTGADELFGGYTRHKNAFKRLGWAGLSKELMLDWKRISFRNLARDNRVICDHGKQPRMPFLDEDFTDFVLKLKPWQRCFPAENLGPGLGDKLILRLVAFKLGLLNVSTFPKRALQFGSKIANKKEKGSDISKKFLYA